MLLKDLKDFIGHIPPKLGNVQVQYLEKCPAISFLFYQQIFRGMRVSGAILSRNLAKYLLTSNSSKK